MKLLSLHFIVTEQIYEVDFDNKSLFDLQTPPISLCVPLCLIAVHCIYMKSIGQSYLADKSRLYSVGQQLRITAIGSLNKPRTPQSFKVQTKEYRITQPTNTIHGYYRVKQNEFAPIVSKFVTAPIPDNMEGGSTWKA